MGNKYAVTATITTPAGAPYDSASYSIQLANPTGIYNNPVPLISGGFYNNAPITGVLSPAGLLSVSLLPTNSFPGTNTWQITIGPPLNPAILTTAQPWGITYNATVTANVDFSSQISALASNVSYLDLVNSQQSPAAVGPALLVANYPNVLGSFVATSGSNGYTQIVTQDLNPQGSASLIMGGDDMTNTTHYFNVSKNGSGSSRNVANVYFVNADASSEYTTDAELDYGVGLVTGGGVINWYVNQATTANMALNAAGLTLTTGTATLPNGIVGVTGGGAAAAGIDGQVISSLVPIGSAVSIATSGTAVNVTSVSLTAGDWDVEGSVNFVAGSATIVGGALHEVGFNTTTVTLPVDGSEVYLSAPTLTTTSANFGTPVQRKVYNVSSTTTVYLVANGTFTAGTEKVYGTITARRIR